MKRKIELYGRLREAGFGAAVALDLPRPATVRQAFHALKAAFGAKAALLDGCALAGDDTVLRAAERLPPGRLAVLPPVCGG